MNNRAPGRPPRCSGCDIAETRRKPCSLRVCRVSEGTFKTFGGEKNFPKVETTRSARSARSGPAILRLLPPDHPERFSFYPECTRSKGRIYRGPPSQNREERGERTTQRSSAVRRTIEDDIKREKQQIELAD